MNCQSALEFLSALYDRELPADRETEVRAHVDSCPACARRLNEYSELTQLTAQLREPKAPLDTWPAISAALEGGLPRTSREPIPRWLRRHSTSAVLAATLMLAASVGLAAFWLGQSHEPHAVMTADFDEYLEQFRKTPGQAPRVLIDRYQGQPIELVRGSQGLSFEPNAPEELPGGFVRQACYVLKMPCCTCTQTVYRNESGSVLALFEHAEQQPAWFGSRPQIEARCHGKATQLVQLPSQLAATWKCGDRHLTLIGAQNVEQVAELVALLDDRT